tara:strand:+ start:494 stop:625 length:132 start_codon:yes stop_codon:yes gene_type:complete
MTEKIKQVFKWLCDNLRIKPRPYIDLGVTKQLKEEGIISLFIF